MNSPEIASEGLAPPRSVYMIAAPHEPRFLVEHSRPGPQS
jgi:hypothetical protein